MNIIENASDFSVSRAERITMGLCDRDDHNYRAQIFRHYPNPLANAMARSYVDTWHESGRREANLALLPYKPDATKSWQKLTSMALSEEKIYLVAKSRAMLCRQIKRPHLSDQAIYEKQAREVQILGLLPPPIEETVTYRSASRRMMSSAWWKRQLRKISAREYETIAIKLNMVHRHKSIYLTDAIYKRIRDQNSRNLETLANLEAINDQGETLDLIDLWEHSLANPAIKRGELMTRIHGFDRVAMELKHEAMFMTITCPSKYHAVLSKSGEPNPVFGGYTPRQAQAYLIKVWSRIRAKLDRDDINIYGFRMVEPHHDGTPHWHLLLFVEPDRVDDLLSICHHYALQDAPNEPGADLYRFKAVPIDRTKGSAVCYVAKYVSKSIDGHGIDMDQYGKDAKRSAPRVVGWSRLWGIRQFQQFGGPPVGIWRELRRLRERPPGLLGEAFDAADTGDWSSFVKLIGGPLGTSAGQIIKLAKLSVADPHTGEIRLNQYLEPASDQIYGVEVEGLVACTRPHKWRVQVKPISCEFNSESHPFTLELPTYRPDEPLEFCQ